MAQGKEIIQIVYFSILKLALNQIDGSCIPAMNTFSHQQVFWSSASKIV